MFLILFGVPILFFVSLFIEPFAFFILSRSLKLPKLQLLRFLVVACVCIVCGILAFTAFGSRNDGQFPGNEWFLMQGVFALVQGLIVASNSSLFLSEIKPPKVHGLRLGVAVILARLISQSIFLIAAATFPPMRLGF